MNIYYVYIYFRLNGIPCYVGKGQTDRIDFHEKAGDRHHNKWLARIIAKAGGSLPKVKVRENLSEAEAFETEIALIAVIGRGKKGPLVNLTDGGEGTSGMRHSKSAREKCRAAKIGKKLSEEHIAKIKASRSSPEDRARMGEANKGRKLSIGHREIISKTFRGKPLSTEHKEKIRAGTVGKKRTPEGCANIQRAKLGTVLSQSHRDKIGAWHRGKILTAEHKAKISMAAIARHALRKQPHKEF